MGFLQESPHRTSSKMHTNHLRERIPLDTSTNALYLTNKGKPFQKHAPCGTPCGVGLEGPGQGSPQRLPRGLLQLAFMGHVVVVLAPCRRVHTEHAADGENGDGKNKQHARRSTAWHHWMHRRISMALCLPVPTVSGAVCLSLSLTHARMHTHAHKHAHTCTHMHASLFCFVPDLAHTHTHVSGDECLCLHVGDAPLRGHIHTFRCTLAGDLTILSQTKLRGQLPSGYRMTVMSTTYRGNSSRLLCEGKHEVRTRIWCPPAMCGSWGAGVLMARAHVALLERGTCPFSDAHFPPHMYAGVVGHAQ